MSTPVLLLTNTPHYKQDPIRSHCSLQEIFRRSLKNQLTDYSHFHNYWEGDIVFLIGNSTSGKSSILKAFRKIDPNRLSSNIDDEALQEEFKIYEKNSPKVIASLERVFNRADLPNALSYGEYHWKEGISRKQKIEAEHIISQLPRVFLSTEKQRTVLDRMIVNAFEQARRGRNMVLECIAADQLIHLQQRLNFHGNTRIALIYCPFNHLLSRIKQRNATANQNHQFSEIRISAGILDQFSYMYTKTKKEKGLETISLQKVAQEFEKAFFEDNDSLRTLFSRRNNFLRSLGFHIRKGELYDQIPADRLNKKISIKQRYSVQLKLENCSTYSRMEAIDIFERCFASFAPPANREKVLHIFLEDLRFPKAGHLSGEETIKIAPANPHYDHLINTSQTSPERAALALHKISCKRKPLLKEAACP